ncbi:MAG: hypothetical protein methR_P1837 [Methyloprofundus sp.]|nr:MAG: hypothetical protein methR_P1837 [Methyloprofundus sp.]
MSRDLHEQILLAASELFYSKGIRATGVDAIAKAAKTTKMTLYRYFPSKDALIVAFLRQRDANFRTWFVNQVESNADNPKDRLVVLFDVIYEWMDNPEFRGCAFINASAEFPAEGNPVHQVSAEFYDKFRGYVADLATQCGAKDPGSLAFQLSLLVEGAIVSEQMQKNCGSAEQAKQAAIILIAASLHEHSV